MTTKAIGHPEKRTIFPGYQQLVEVRGRGDFSPRVLVVRSVNLHFFDTIVEQIEERERQREKIRYETTEEGTLNRYERISAIEAAWRSQRISVRRRILWLF